MGAGDKLLFEVASIINQVQAKRHSLRSLVFSSNYQNKKQLYRLCCEVLKNWSNTERILSNECCAELLRYEIYSLTPCILQVLLHEFLFSPNGLKCSKKLLEPIERRKEVLETEKEKLSENDVEIHAQSESYNIPRYARINRLVSDRKTIVQTLTENNWQLVSHDGNEMSRKKFRHVISSLNPNQFCIDKDIDDLLVFPSGTDLHNDWLVQNGHLILQDKASCLSSVCLNPQPGSHVIDACAAPGMKTSHLASLMRNKGKLFAFDKDRNRVKTMKQLLERSNVSCAQVDCFDFLKINIKDKKYKQVKYILVDPPCSGSGIANRMDHLTDNQHDKSEQRINSLGNLQAMLLKTALRFPSVQRLVYSTCSIFCRENEDVIKEVLEDVELSRSFILVDPMSSWKHRGKRGYNFSKLCLRSSPEKDLTNGFFVAMFERKDDK